MHTPYPMLGATARMVGGGRTPEVVAQAAELSAAQAAAVAQLAPAGLAGEAAIGLVLAGLPCTTDILHAWGWTCDSVGLWRQAGVPTPRTRTEALGRAYLDALAERPQAWAHVLTWSPSRAGPVRVLSARPLVGADVPAPPCERAELARACGALRQACLAALPVRERLRAWPAVLVALDNLARGGAAAPETV